MRYRFKREDIRIRKDEYGNYVLSLILDGQILERKYMFFTKAEAIKQFQQQYGVYTKDYKPLGVLGLNNHDGIAIMKIIYDFDDYVIVCDNYDGEYKNITKNKIRYTKDGKQYFIRDNNRYYLGDFIGLNY